MKKKFLIELGKQLKDFHPVSMGNSVHFFISAESDIELLKGVYLAKARSGIAVMTWFCPLLHFSYSDDEFIFMIFEGWDFGGNESGLISFKVSGEFMAPKKDEAVLAKDIADYIHKRMNMLKSVKDPNGIIELSKLYPRSFSAPSIAIQLGLLQCGYGDMKVGEKLIKDYKGSISPLIKNDVEAFVSSIENGGDAISHHINNIKLRNKKHLEENGFFKR